MPVTIDADRLDVLGARVAVACGVVTTVRTVAEACRRVPWVEAAATTYRAAMDGALVTLRRLDVQLDQALAVLRAMARLTWLCTPDRVATRAVSGAWGVPSPAIPEIRWDAAARSAVIAADGFISVDPDDLGRAANLLGAGAEALDEADADVRRAMRRDVRRWWGSTGDGLEQARAQLDAILSGAVGPRRTAGTLRDLATATRRVAELHAAGEEQAGGWLRRVVSAWPNLPGPALLAGSGVTGGFALLTLGSAAVEAVRSGPGAVPRVLGESAADVVLGGGVELAVTGLAAGLRGLAPSGRWRPPETAVDDVAALLGLIAAAVDGAPSLVPVVEPPRLAPPRDLQGLLRIVARADDQPGPDGDEPVDRGTVTVQRLDHADGTRSWVVAVPGTQTPALGGDVPTDMATNFEAFAGIPDAMSLGVLAAMDDAGIPADEPVVLVGHSQGGMVALTVATVATGAYTIGAVVTAGAPSPRLTPTRVPVVRLEHTVDAIPQLDGEPTVAGRNVTRVAVELPEGTPPTQAHHLEGYCRSARLVDEQVAGAPGALPAVEGVDRLLGGPGTTATTMQYRVSRS